MFDINIIGGFFIIVMSGIFIVWFAKELTSQKTV
jgi:hypothetical protein